MDLNTSTSTVTKADIRVGSKIGAGVVLGLGVAFLASYLMAGFFFFQSGQKPFGRNNPIIRVRLPAIPLLVEDLQDADMSANIEVDPGTIISYAFVRNDVHLGTLNPVDNTYTDQIYTSPDGSSPLLVGLTAPSDAPFTYPARVITANARVVGDPDYQIYTLCVPETTVSDYTATLYFYDIHGTPYTDSLLTQRAMTTTCPDAFANAYRPLRFSSGAINEPFPEDVNETLQVVFRRSDDLLAQYYRFDGRWTFAIPPENQGDPDDPTPLHIDVGIPGPLAGSYPTRSFTVVSELGATTTLCLPGASFPDGSFVSFYYDTDGNPYSDLFLTHPVSCSIGGASPSILKTDPLPASAQE